jgi:hypothetical protein
MDAGWRVSDHYLKKFAESGQVEPKAREAERGLDSAEVTILSVPSRSAKGGAISRTMNAKQRDIMSQT